VPGPNCHRCDHFRVTWDGALPYACDAFGFRSRRLPSIVVRETSAQDCSLFRPKPERPAGEQPPGESSRGGSRRSGLE